MMPQFVNAIGGRAFEHHTAYITEGARAAALWLPPGIEPDEAEMSAVMEQSLRPEIAADIGAVTKGMAEHHPHELHWYLPLVAADPNWIGQGLGTLLMEHALRRCDEEGVAAYLESSNPRNISSMNAMASRLSARYRRLFSRDDTDAAARIPVRSNIRAALAASDCAGMG